MLECGVIIIAIVVGNHDFILHFEASRWFTVCWLEYDDYCEHMEITHIRREKLSSTENI